MDLHLEGKVVILTGGFKGIGKGVALRLAKRGPSCGYQPRRRRRRAVRRRNEGITDNYRTYLMDLNDTDDIAPIVRMW